MFQDLDTTRMLKCITYINVFHPLKPRFFIWNLFRETSKIWVFIFLPRVHTQTHNCFLESRNVSLSLFHLMVCVTVWHEGGSWCKKSMYTLECACVGVGCVGGVCVCVADEPAMSTNIRITTFYSLTSLSYYGFTSEKEEHRNSSVLHDFDWEHAESPTKSPEFVYSMLCNSSSERRCYLELCVRPALLEYSSLKKFQELASICVCCRLQNTFKSKVFGLPVLVMCLTWTIDICTVECRIVESIAWRFFFNNILIFCRVICVYTSKKRKIHRNRWIFWGPVRKGLIN